MIKMKTNTIIDWNNYLTPGAKVFIGRDRGEEVRTATRIDEIEPEFDRITIVIPKDVRSVNPSFLEEYFYNIIPRLGKYRFLEKFKFQNAERYKIESDLEDAIDRRLREHNALVF